MTIQEEVISLIGKLDYTWYTSVNDLFIAEKGYDFETKKVKRTVPDYYSYSDQETGEAFPYDWEVSCGIEKYAWDYGCIEYPLSRDPNEYEDEILPVQDNKLPVQGHVISSLILKIISDYLNDSQEVIKQDTFITKVMTIVIEKVKGIENTYREIEYSKVARYFFESFRAEVSGQYRHIRRNADKQRDFNTFVETDLSKEIETNTKIDQDTNYDPFKPIFKEELISAIFDILKVHFQKVEHEELLRILQTGDIASKKLHFNSSGNRLAEAFRCLFVNMIISGCQKKELAIWILNNFTFRKKDSSSEFSLRTLEDYISSKDGKCANPLFEVKKEAVTGQYFFVKS